MDLCATAAIVPAQPYRRPLDPTRSGGRLIADGTLEELRAQAGERTTSLEEAFLTLVAAEAAAA